MEADRLGSARVGVAIGTCILLMLWPGYAGAKGLSYYLPGEKWGYQTELEFGSPVAAAAAGDKDWAGYLVPHGRESSEGIPVGHVLVRHLESGDKNVRVRVSFRIPDVAGGRYRVVICSSDCRERFGAARLVGRLIVLDSRSERLIMNKLDLSIVGVTDMWFSRLKAQQESIQALELEQSVMKVALDELGNEMADLKSAARADADVNWWLGLGSMIPAAGFVLWRRRRARRSLSPGTRLELATGEQGCADVFTEARFLGRAP